MKRAVWIAGVWCCAVGATVLMMSTVLPWMGKHGYAGSVIQQNYLEQTDASALFWTESDRTLEILATMERERSQDEK